MRISRRFALFVALLMLPSPISAQQTSPTVSPTVVPAKPRVAVVDVATPAELALYRERVRQGMAQAIEASSRVRSVPPERVEAWLAKKTKEEEGASASESLKEARTLFTQGKAKYEKLEFKGAAARFDAARKAFISNLHLLRSNREVVDVQIYLGMSYLGLKQTKNAGEAFRRAVHLDPKRELTSRDYPPNVVQAFVRAKQEVLALDPVEVRVESVPQGGEIYLNGRHIGATPLATTLAPAEYFFLVELKGFRTWYAPVSLSRRIENVRATLDPSPGAQERAALFRVREGADQESQDIEELNKLGGEVGTDLVVLTEIVREKNFRILGQLYDVRTADFSQVAVITVDEKEESLVPACTDLVETLLSFVRNDGFLVTSRRPDLTIPAKDLTVGGADRPPTGVGAAPPPPTPWYKKWWMWPIIGAAAAGITLGILSFSDSGPRIVVDNKNNL